MSLNDEYRNDLIQRIYDAALDDTQWPSLIIEIGQLINATDSALFSQPLSLNSKPFILSPSHHADVDVWQDYATYYWQQMDVAYETIKKELFKAGTIIHSNQFLQRSDIQKTEIYNKLFMAKPGGIGVVMCVVLFDESMPELSPPMFLTFYKSVFANAFTQQEERRIRNLLPFLQGALRIRWKRVYERQMRLLRELTLEHMAAAIILLHNNGRLLYANQKAEDLLNQKGHPTTINGYFCSRDVEKNNAIKLALHQAHQGIRSTLRFDNAAPLGLIVATFSSISATQGDDLLTPAHIMVMMTMPNKLSHGDLGGFSQLYRLSTGEIRLLKHLLQQQSTREIAESLQISMPTLRTQMSALYAKTNTKNQRELIRFCLSHPMID